jgi:hypothetical protein
LQNGHWLLFILQSICGTTNQCEESYLDSEFYFNFYSITILGKPMSSFLIKRSGGERSKEKKIKDLE